MAALGQIDNNAVSKYLGTGKKLGSTPAQPSEELNALRTAASNVDSGDGQSTPGLARNLGKTFLSSTVNLGNATIESGRQLGLISNETANQQQKLGSESAQKLGQSTSPSFQKEAAKQIFDENGKYTGDFSGTTLLHRLVSSTPDLLATVGPAGLASKGLKALGASSKIAGALGAGAAEGVVAGAEGASQKRGEVLNTPIEQLRNSPEFQSSLVSQDQSIPLDQREQKAREDIAGKAASDVFGQTAASTGIIGVATGGGALGSILASSGGKITKSIIKSVGKGFAEEALQEAPQSYNEQLISNAATKKYVDPNKNIMDGTLNALAEGAVTGGVLGGVGAGGAHVTGSIGSKPVDHSEAVQDLNPLTGEKFQNKDVINAYTKYNNTFKNVGDTQAPAYQEIYNAAKTNLDGIIQKEQESSQPDAIKVSEAKTVLDLIQRSHESLSKQEDLVKQQDQEATKQVDEATKVTPESFNPDNLSGTANVTDSSPAAIDNTVSPEAPNVNDITSAFDNKTTIQPIEGINANQIESTATTDVSSGAQPQVQEASGPTSESSTGLHTSGQETGQTQEQKVGNNGSKIIQSQIENLDNTIKQLPKDSEELPNIIARRDALVTHLNTNNNLESIVDSSKVSQSTPEPVLDRRDNTSKRDRYSKLILDRKIAENRTLKSDLADANKELRTSSVTGLPNKKAFTELAPPPFVASVDIDSLKYINDNLGHDAGNELLKTVAKVIAKHSDAYHISGDEILVRGNSQQELETQLRAAQTELRSGEHIITGDKATFNKPGFSYGIAPVSQDVPSAVKQSDLSMLDNKIAREATGERAARGEKPDGFQDIALTPAEEDVKIKSLSNIQSIKDALESEEVTVDNGVIEDNSIEPNLSPYSLEDLHTLDQVVEAIYNKDLEIKEAKDNGESLEVRKSLQQERTQLGLKKAEIEGVTRTTPVKVSPKNNLFNDEIDEDDNGDFTEISFDTSGSIFQSKTTFEQNKTTLKRLTDSLKKSVLDNISFHYIEDFNTHDWANEPNMSNSIKSRTFSSKERAFIVTSKGKSSVYFNDKLIDSTERLVGTFAHEVIGHFGLRKIFTNRNDEISGSRTGYDTFLLDLVNNNPKMRADILSLLPRWKTYLMDYNLSRPENHINTLSSDQVIQFGREKVPVEVAIKLADEYMAELAKAKFLNRQFVDKEVGLGASLGKKRSALRIQRDNWFNGFIRKVRHMFRRVFGDVFANNISDQDLEQVIAKSVDDQFEVLSDKYLDTPFDSSNYLVYGGLDTPETNIPYQSNGEVQFDSEELDEDLITHKMTLIDDTSAFITGTLDGFGSLSDTIRSKAWKVINQKINDSPILASFKTFGNMSYQDAYTSMQNIFKGNISQVEKSTHALAKALNGLNALQNQAVFEYFTTKDAQVDSLPLTPIQKNIVKNAKDNIRNVGRSLADLNIINKDSFEKNEDAYLHTVYLKYVDQYRGSNKKTSMLSWAKSQKNLSEREKLALGQIKDVKFLVPETLGVLLRDHTLLTMFSTLNQMSNENNLFWVMTNNAKIKYGTTKLDIDSAYEQLDRNNFIIDQHSKVDKNTFGTTDTQIEQLKKDTESLKVNIDAVENAILSQAHSHALSNNQTTEQDKHAFLRQHYVRLPKKPQLGRLSNKWVRKEIANDLDAITSAYTLHDKNTIERFFAQGGTLERINRFWKMSMVALNPGSWVRNTFGNFALLDLSTSTNKAKLIGMLHQEISGTLSGNQSEYWRLADQYGLFGSTWSAVELQDIYNNYGDDLKKAQIEFHARENTPIDQALHFTDERLLAFGRIAGHKIGNSTSKAYALLEGTFKTVSFRDYIQQWESQNKDQYPNGYKDQQLTASQRQIIFSKAASHANESLFDYSQVNSMVKTLRRVPFGAPFITFSYKAGPAAIKAMVNHPIKFAQYATLPALLTTIAMMANDWDDDDIAKFRQALPDYYRTNPGVAFLPFKDKVGRVQILPLDYIIPWSQYTTAARAVYENFKVDGGESPISTGIKSGGTVLNKFGFLGGPTPSAISAMLSGKDKFTGQSIITPGASASQQLGESMTFAYNMITPAWLSSHGWFAKMYDAFKDKPTTNKFGDIKFTPLQAVADITGFRATSVNVQAGLQNRKTGFEYRLKETATLRSKIIHDPNETNKAAKLRDVAQREKLIRIQMSEALK
jgi:GGDEF domain-containing protein